MAASELCTNATQSTNSTCIKECEFRAATYTVWSTTYLTNHVSRTYLRRVSLLRGAKSIPGFQSLPYTVHISSSSSCVRAAWPKWPVHAFRLNSSHDVRAVHACTACRTEVSAMARALVAVVGALAR